MAGGGSSTTCALFLFALGIGDFLTAWMQLPEYVSALNPNLLTLNNTYGYINAYTQGWYMWMQMMWPAFSNWVLVAFSVVRIRALLDPLVYSGPPSVRSVRMIIACAITYAATTNAYKCVLQYYLLATTNLKTFTDESRKIFIPDLPFWLQMWSSINAFYKVVELAVVFAVLLGIIICIVYYVARRRPLSVTSGLSIRAFVGKLKVEEEEVQLGWVHILLCTASVYVYVICLFPLAINEALSLLSGFPYCLSRYLFYNVLLRPAQLLMLIPYSVKFYLYLAFCKIYRKQAKKALYKMKNRTCAGLADKKAKLISGTLLSRLQSFPA